MERVSEVVVRRERALHHDPHTMLGKRGEWGEWMDGWRNRRKEGGGRGGGKKGKYVRGKRG